MTACGLAGPSLDERRRDLRADVDRERAPADEPAAVGWVDLLMTSGQYQHMPKPPYCPGLEFCGEIVWAPPPPILNLIRSAVNPLRVLESSIAARSVHSPGVAVSHRASPRAASTPSPVELTV